MYKRNKKQAEGSGLQREDINENKTENNRIQNLIDTQQARQR
jgi:hypothetical protein